MNLNYCSNLCHQRMIKWWQDPTTGEPIARNKGELLGLMHTEISECFEGESENLMDDKLPHRKMGEVELADLMIRIFDYAGGFNHDLGAAGLMIGISEFSDLNHIGKCAMIPPQAAGLYQMVSPGMPSFKAICVIHLQISKVIEHERKGRSKEACGALLMALVYTSVYGNNRGYDLTGAFIEKSQFNAIRPDHTHEVRRVEGGKQF